MSSNLIKTIASSYPICVKNEGDQTKWINLAHVRMIDDFRDTPTNTAYIKITYQNGEIDLFSGDSRMAILSAIAELESKIHS